MKYNYKRTFDAVSMPPEHQEQIRAALSSRISEIQEENNVMNTKSSFNRTRRAVVIAAIIVLSFALLVGFTYGSQIIQLLGGGRLEVGANYVKISTGFESDPAEVRDGQVYFVLDGADTDITSYCTKDTYYQYEQINDNGYRHVVLVGGAPDDLGWAEFVWDESGKFVAGNSTRNSEEIPAWLILGRETLGARIVSE